MKILTVILKQHTPLLHFQSHQEGATLRASEVKPQLDKYILNLLQIQNKEDSYKKILKNILQPKKQNNENKQALNYKLRIEVLPKDRIDMNVEFTLKYDSDARRDRWTGKPYPLVLSIMGKEDDKNDFVNFSFYKTIKLTFLFVQNGDCEEYIKRYISSFFALHNFGQRCNKGFGSFTVVKINERPIEWQPSDLYPKATSYLQFSINPGEISKSVKNIFQVIDFYWKVLKSGINLTQRSCPSRDVVIRKNDKRYIKSYLYQYLNQKGLTWEKRTIKTGLNLTCTRPEKEKENNNSVFFARAHLGCPINGFTYMIPYYDNQSHSERKLRKNITITNNKKLERIPAPIIFKPVIENNNVCIYLVIDHIVVQALKKCDDDTEFTFKKSDRNHQSPSVSLPLFQQLNDKKYIIDYQDLINKYNASLNNQFIARGFRWENVLDTKESKGNIILIKKLQ